MILNLYLLVYSKTHLPGNKALGELKHFGM